MSRKTKIVFLLVLVVALTAIFLFLIIGRNDIPNEGGKNINSDNQNDGGEDVKTVKNKKYYLSRDEKKVYGVDLEEKVIVEIIPGGKDSIGPLPKIYLSSEETTGSPSAINDNADSDGDGITDSDELKVYHTDHNNPDTDGDGYLDGEEVRNGYNPLGEGRL